MPTNAAEVDHDSILKVRAFLSDLLLQQFPDLDTRPNTPFGDWMLTPFAWMLAAAEIGQERFMSDMDLENTAAGVTWNCDFVRQLLANLGMLDLTGALSSGPATLTFNSASQMELDRSTRFSINSTETWTMRLPLPGPLVLVPPNGVPPPNSNWRRLIPSGAGLWTCSVVLEGPNKEPVVQDASFKLDRRVPSMVSATADAAFDLLGGVTTLASLAKAARSRNAAGASGTRGGIRSQVLRAFEAASPVVSVVLSGDGELARAAANAMGIAKPCCDVLFKSHHAFTEHTQTIELVYHDADSTFHGKLDLRHAPLKVTGVADGEFTVPLHTVELYSRAVSKAFPGLSCGLGTSEELWVSIPMPLDSSGAPVIKTYVSGIDTVGAFTITYLADPYLRTAADVMAGPDGGIAGLSTQVKAFTYHDMSLEIKFKERRGKSLKLQQAAEEIYQYVNSLAWPETWSDGVIADIMYYAGVDATVAIVPTSTLRPTCATRMILGTADPTQLIFPIYTLENSTEAPAVLLQGSDALYPEFTGYLQGAVETHWGCGPRSVAFHLPLENIIFSAVV